MPEHVDWWGYFDPQGTPVIVRYESMFFTVAPEQDTSQHIRILFDEAFEDHFSLDISWVPIRVVGSHGKTWCVDPLFLPEQAPF